MFIPNLIGSLSTVTSRDVHGRSTFAEPVPCAFGVVNFDIGSIKTSVRADSSASRGSADETVAMRAKILIDSQSIVTQGDRFTFEDQHYLVASVHVRRTVCGEVDHFEVGLELMP